MPSFMNNTLLYSNNRNETGNSFRLECIIRYSGRQFKKNGIFNDFSIQTFHISTLGETWLVVECSLVDSEGAEG